MTEQDIQLPTLKEFLDKHASTKSEFGHRSYVTHTGIRTLYVRLRYRLLDKELKWVLDIANIEVEKQRDGAMTRLVAWVRSNYPELPIFVESVLNESFRRHGIKKIGFEAIEGRPFDFVMYPKESK